MEPNREAPTVEVCGKCGSNTAFEWDDVEGFVSVCCTWTPMRVDVEAPE